HRRAPSHSNSLFHSAVVAPPHKEISDVSRIVPNLAHGRSLQERHTFAIYSQTVKPATITSILPFSLLRHLIPVTARSSKIPITGRVRKESVKVRTSKSPTSADYSALYFAAPHVFPHRARAEPQHAC